VSHQHHFLSRLDRVSLPHVELALSLYRDPELLRFILGSVRLPEAAERVALSLDHPERGPFLIVTRTGRFVTCLAEGMAVDIPIVTRGQLDGIAVKASDLRARLQACQELAGARGGVRKLLGRLFEAGNDVTREEFVAISALQPLYGFEFFRLLFASVQDLDAARDILLPAMRRSDRLKPVYRSALREYWNTFYAIGHFSVLAGMSGPAIFDHVPQLREQLLEVSFSWGAVRQGVISLAMKGIWAVARIGKAYLPTYKRLFDKASSLLTLLDAGMGLAALSMRHAKLRAEVEKTIAVGPTIDRETPVGKYVGTLFDLLSQTLEVDFRAPEVAAELQRSVGAAVCLRSTAHLPKGAPFRFERGEDVPEQLAMTMAANADVGFLDDVRMLLPLVTPLPWVSRATPEQLYLPADFIKATRTPWTPEHSYVILRAHRDHYKQPAPSKSVGPTRNGPCPCGSGKKYKRCCGEDAAG
jgi:uncharacterized protein YchJ